MVNNVIPGGALYVKNRYLIVFVLRVNKCLRNESLKFLLNIFKVKLLTLLKMSYHKNVKHLIILRVLYKYF